MAASEHQEVWDLPLRLQRKPECRAGRVPATVCLRLSKGGVVIVDQNTRLSRVLGIVTIPTSPNTGSVTHADFAQGLPWWVTTNGGVAGTYFNITPAMSFSGTTLSWDWGTLPFKTATTLIYGVY